MKLINVCLLLLAHITLSSAYNILFMGPFPAPSHWMWLDNFVRELLDRGHHVTAVTNHKTKYPHENYTEIIISPFYDIPKQYSKKEIFNMRFSSDFQNLQMWWSLGVTTSEYALNDPKVQKLIQSKDQKFDAFILEQFFHESFLMFGHKFNAPVITIGTMGYADNMDHTMGLLTPWSFIPHLLLPHRDEMNFQQRAFNTFLSLYDYILRRWQYFPKMQDMAEKHFGPYIDGPVPSIRELEKNISLMLINSHRSIDIPRPTISGLVNVGGVHIKPVKPLPEDIRQFLDKATEGVVYFSLGSYIKSTDMPSDKIKILIDGFSRLKQKVLWKFEDESIQNLPKNIMIKKWMPQNDILAHKNVVLFIGHGGLFGTQEGVYWGKPMICIPFYGDQHRNTLKSVNEGYALPIVFSELTADELTSKVTEILSNPKYTTRAKELSVLFRDNPIHPMDEAMYWIEYVIRHKGAKHLKSKAVNLPFYQYVLLDVVLVYSIPILVLFYIIWKAFKFGIFFYLRSSDSNGNSKTIKVD